MTLKEEIKRITEEDKGCNIIIQSYSDLITEDNIHQFYNEPVFMVSKLEHEYTITIL